ncbi:NAD(P)/FAD-dependent oxidoreductase [Helicovermis profundi]|uniref:NAD(P)/FAD-dependent oxidoreductase n=1 Tax=Helicovermis profundi TaxID=3065157 RepID=A0AAU9ED52_9FIRM|nr:NAD(P)/FAD-dependent oxidoreductase [Clostridia bacterium S502]
MYDVAIIGAGVIGTIIARTLSKYKLDIVILERDNDVSNGTSKANSAIIHAGYDAPFNTKKGKLNVKGNKMFDKICSELNVPFKRIGSLVVAKNEEEIKVLYKLKENGEKLGVENLKILDGKNVAMLEKNLTSDVLKALYAPTAGIIEPWELTIALAENAMDNGVKLELNFEVNSIKVLKEHFLIKSNDKKVEAKIVVNAAGVYADDIYNMVTDKPEFSIRPRRGQYFLLDKEARGFVEHIIFPTPTSLGKGTLITPTIDGNILIGPDSENLNKNSKESINTTFERLNLVKKLAKNLTDKIPYNLNITTFSGLRAEATIDDFIIEESKKIPKFINVAGIKSPGLSSSPAIAEYVEEILKNILKNVSLKENYNPYRRARIKFDKLSIEDKNELIKKEPSFGRIICRCEMITEGEIIDAIHRNAGARTINGVKRRVRAGSGRCQGGFCAPRVMEILAKELNLKMEDIVMENKESYILSGKTKS